MDSISRGGVSVAGRALRQLGAWPALRACRGDAVGARLAVDSRLIVAVHREDQAEVHLTRPAITRMREALVASGRVQVRPDSDWVGVTLDCDSDVALLESLVSVAIKAHSARP